MAIPTTYEVEFSCGHTGTVDLSKRKPGDRAGLVRFFERKGQCPDCWREAHRGEWAQKMREQDREDAAHFDQLNGLPELTGSPKAVGWADTLRAEAIKSLHEQFVPDRYPDDEAFDTDVLAPAKEILRAGWWIDNREYEGEDLLEIILAEVADPESRNVTENVD